jgi:hypothetical protein
LIGKNHVAALPEFHAVALESNVWNGASITSESEGMALEANHGKFQKGGIDVTAEIVIGLL